MRVKIFNGSWDKYPCGGKTFTSAEDKTNWFIERIEKTGGTVLNIDVRSDNSIVVTYKENK